jgi:RNA polymerase sigma-70 factor (sigma-E family)
VDGRSQHRDEGFERFVLDAYPGLVRFGTLLVGDRAGGEDVAQAALVEVHGRWQRVEHPAAYIRSTMVRLAGKWGRRRSSGERPAPISPDAVAALDTSDDVAVADGVRRALATLPLEQRAVLVLRYYEDRSEDDIAHLLGIAPGTVKSRASRGLAALRTLGLLRDDDAVGEPR